MQTLTCRTNRREGGPWYVPHCSQLRGRWSSHDPVCKTTAAKCAKCLESRRVSHLSPAQTNPKQPACTCVENRSPPAAPPLPGLFHPPPSAFHPFSRAAHLDRYYITFYSVLPFRPISRRRQGDERDGSTPRPDRTSHISQTSLLCTCSPAGPPGLGTLRWQICARTRVVTPCFAAKCFPPFAAK